MRFFEKGDYLGNQFGVSKTSSNMVKEFESVELGDMRMKKQKVPRRTIYFASGETMEEYSTDEDGEVQVSISVKTSADPVGFSGLYSMTFCDYLGERMASLFGITSPKYQYAIDEYYRMKKEEDEEEEENRLSEEAERHFEEEHNQEIQQPAMEQPEGKASFVNVSFELDQDPTPDANRCPAPIPT
ncbi:protein FAM177A1-like isoform X2 [Oncorhynchus nerka]|uniref:protein FAM177A1-like isoform X2 n=1 Tax=Oncorhynchus nerka TaxID=8023 RepID=UPI0011307F99|nr:protein FAM177A1-like isoform X2 [Oncorhynchus nerka]